ncbi:MAG: tetratricopeptide repeat protein [Candidatus Helarchaeota archaeon]
MDDTDSAIILKISKLRDSTLKIMNNNPKLAIVNFKRILKMINQIKIIEEQNSINIFNLKTEILYYLGVLYQKVGKKNKAIDFFNKAALNCGDINNEFLTAAIAAAILKLDKSEKTNKSKNFKDERIKNKFKFLWLYFLINLIPWILLIIFILLYIQ